MTKVDQLDLLRPVVKVISAYLANHETAAEALPELIRSVHAAFSTAREELKPMPAADCEPAVLVQGSLFRGVNIRGQHASKKPRLLRKARSNSFDSRSDLDATSSTLASATALKKKSTELGGSPFPDIQRIPEGVSGIRRGRNTAFRG